jgi:hypothetical protein
MLQDASFLADFSRQPEDVVLCCMLTIRVVIDRYLMWSFNGWLGMIP